MHKASRPLEYRCRGAFTIIELLVTLVIIAMLSATALLTVRLPLRQAELELAIEHVQSMDALARGHADKGQPVTLGLFPAEKRLVLTTRSGELLASRQLPSHVGLLRTVVHNRSPAQSAVELRYERNGSPTFAVLLGKPGKGQRWLLVCGLSGEAYRLDKLQGDHVVAGLFIQKRNIVD